MRKKYEHEKELRNLTILNQIKHPNVVELLGSYTQRGKHNLLFPLCSDGNLSQLFLADRLSTSFTVESTLLIAVADLASAVEHVHNFVEERLDLALIGCHHDLRPHNILVHGSRLILADFGISTLKPQHEESDTGFKSVNSDYLAPECEDWEDNFKSADVHRSADIWAFGAILIDIATYLTEGSKAVEEFRGRRIKRILGIRLWPFHNGLGCPSAVVEQHIETLVTKYPQTCGTLVATARRMLAMDEKQRPKAGEVTIRLRFTAMKNLADAIKQRFDNYRLSNDTVDKAMEHRRFDSWVYAIGVDNFESRFDADNHGVHQLGARFSGIVKSLEDIREDLDLSIRYESEGQHKTMSSISTWIDHLETHLDQEQQQQARTHFKLSALEDGLIPTELRNSTFSERPLHKEIQMRAIIKHMNTLVSSASTPTEGSKLLDGDAIHTFLPMGASESQLAKLKDGAENREILIDWRQYLNHGADKTTMNILHARVEHIAQTLSRMELDEVRTLRFSGYFHSLEKARFGIVFEVPRSLNPHTGVEPTTLTAIIEKTTQTTRAWPDLEDRYRLHSVGMLHKNLTSSNVVFFPPIGTQVRDSVKEPFLIGFSHSRSDEPQAFTEGMAESSTKDYQHPIYIKHGKGYRPEFDYFSLGIILLEIGFWKPYSKIIEDLTVVDDPTGQKRKPSYEERPQVLFGGTFKKIQSVAAYMGRTYLESAKFCILGDISIEKQHGGGEDGGTGTANRDLFLEFNDKVVRPLNLYF
jgi:serine/threonine protein kinase